MTLSIIVPVYNVEKYINACIDSIICQSFKDWELLLIDDGSSDNSGNICDEYACKDKRIRVIHVKNGGPSEARNRGLRESHGEFVTFIDSDDIVKPSFLSNFLFDNKLDFEIQGFTLNYVGHERYNRIIKPVETKISPIKDVYSESELNKLSRGPVCKLFKKSIIANNNIVYPKGIKFGEDAIFVKRYLLCCFGNGRTISAADYIYNHFQNEKSLTNQKHPGQMMYDVVKKDFELFEQLNKQWGGISLKCVLEFNYIRTLELYNSIYTYFTEGGHSIKELNTFLEIVKSGLYLKIRQNLNIPISYKIIRFIMNNFSTRIASNMLRIFLNVMKH